MPERITRKPYDHALHLINTVCQGVDRIAEAPDGQPRNLPGSTAVGALAATAGAAVAAALLAVADAIRGDGEA